MSGRHFAAGGDLTLRQAFHAQTVSAAWLGYRERTAGVLASGYDADFLVLDTADVLALVPATGFGRRAAHRDRRPYRLLALTAVTEALAPVRSARAVGESGEQGVRTVDASGAGM